MKRKKNINSQEDLFLKELFKELPKEELSIDFSDQVMNKIWQEESIPIRVEPLISKRIWIILASAFVILFAFVLFHANETESYPEVTSLLKNIFSYLSNIEINFLSISLNVFYGVLALFILIIGDTFHTLKHQKHFLKKNFIFF